MFKRLELNDSELLTMRESGMTNQDIANSLGVSYNTILRRIGAADFRRVGGAPSFSKPKKPPEPEYEACLVVQTEQIKAAGLKFSYTIAPNDSTVEVFGDGEIKVKFEDLPDLIKELTAINRKTESLRINNEMW